MTAMISLNGRATRDTQTASVVEGPNSVPADHLASDTQGSIAGGYGPKSDDGRPTSDTQSATAVVVPTSPEPAIPHSTPIVAAPVRGSTPPAPARSRAATTPSPLVLADPLLALAADVLDDLERVRIANENRLRQLTRDETDADGEERGFGLTLAHPDVARLAALVNAIGNAEHDAELQLGRKLRGHPLGPWVRAQRGVGDKQGARLLAAVGDPYWNTLHDRPRTVSELWAYCGYVPGQRRRRGVKDNWSATAKMRAFVIAESCVKQLVKPCSVVKGDKGEYLHAVHVEGCACSPYRLVYDEGREKYAGTVHPEACVRCGPTGQPAAAGSPRSAAHQGQMAIRLATKRFLRDLWREAKRLHEATTDVQDNGQTYTGTQSPGALS